MADTTLTLTGAAGVATVTPQFDFTAGTVKVEVEDVYIEDLTSGVAGNITLAAGEKLEYIISDYNSVTKIDIGNDIVSGDISGWTLPDNLIYFDVHSTSVSGDISSWVLPDNLVYLYVHLTSVSGDISGWTLPSNLMNLYAYSTSVSGDISGWILLDSLVRFSVYSTSVSGDISGWTLPISLRVLRVDSTSITYKISVGAFVGITDNLTDIDFSDNSLPQTQVDSILANCVTSGIDNSARAKTLEVDGDNATPSGIGFLNKTILEARGWTVNITTANYYTTPVGIQLSRTGQRFSSFPEN